VLRLERESVLLLARDAVALGHVLAGLAHRLEREHLLHPRVREPPPEGRVVDDLVPARKRVFGLAEDERRARHRLDASGHEEISFAGGDRVAGGDDRRQPGCAEAVDGHARDRVRQPRQQRRHPGDVAIVLSGLVRGAKIDLLDVAAVDTGAIDGLADHERREVVGPHVREHAAVAADGRPDAAQDHGPAHGARLADTRA
jgi:hypothetical protein